MCSRLYVTLLVAYQTLPAAACADWAPSFVGCAQRGQSCACSSMSHAQARPKLLREPTGMCHVTLSRYRHGVVTHSYTSLHLRMQQTKFPRNSQGHNFCGIPCEKTSRDDSRCSSQQINTIDELIMYMIDCTHNKQCHSLACSGAAASICKSRIDCSSAAASSWALILSASTCSASHNAWFCSH